MRRARSRSRAGSESPVIASPAISIVPASARRIPATRWSSVVLPLPLSPETATSSPGVDLERGHVDDDVLLPFGVAEALDEVADDEGFGAHARLRGGRYDVVRLLTVAGEDVNSRGATRRRRARHLAFAWR